MLPYTANQRLTLPGRHGSNFVPIFFSDIIVDFYCARVETVASTLLAAGNPITFSGLPIKIVRFEPPARKGMESASPVV